MRPATNPPDTSGLSLGLAVRAGVIAGLGIALAIGAYLLQNTRRSPQPPGDPDGPPVVEDRLVIAGSDGFATKAIATPPPSEPLFSGGEEEATPQLPNVLDQPLGVKRALGVKESGFYNTEAEDTPDPFRWTNGSARLVVPFEGPAPIALSIRLGLGVPKATKLAIRANGHSLFDETVEPRAEWTRRFDLSELVTEGPITVEILSDTFVPSGTNDDRALGVCVRGITLISTIPDYSGVNLAARPVPGVEESGFHNCEQCGDQPCRWTDGNARVVVPVPRGRRWRTLKVSAEIPNRPDWRVKVTVNGRTLFDDFARSGMIWTKSFSLTDLKQNQQAVIEITSAIIKSGQIKSGDGRDLGIRLRQLTLLGD